MYSSRLTRACLKQVKERAGDVAWLEECLPSVHKALDWLTSAAESTWRDGKCLHPSSPPGRQRLEDQQFKAILV